MIYLRVRIEVIFQSNHILGNFVASLNYASATQRELNSQRRVHVGFERQNRNKSD